MWFLAFLCACLTHTIFVEAVETRLIPGPDKGRVEVYFIGDWGTVCDDHFDVADARVVCRSVGHLRKNPVVVSSAYFGRGSGEIHLDNVICTGFEVNLANCSHSGWGIENCEHSEDVGVICHEVEAVETRLIPGPDKGRVEVYFNGVWGTVCDDHFDVADARVVCRSVEQPSMNPEIVTSARFGYGSGEIHMDDVACTGLEDNLAFCNHRGWGIAGCDHFEDVGIICQEGKSTWLPISN